MKLDSAATLIDEIRQGRMVILMDDEDRENEGDLILAAEHVRPEDINFMARNARGLICLTLTSQRCKLLDLPIMVQNNNSVYSTNFTLSIEAAEGVTTGISAADRAHTVRMAVKKDACAKDIVQPGHIFPVMSQAGGVLTRAGHTEAGCDLARLAGFEPASVIVEIMNDDGSMARRSDLEKFAKEHQLKIGTISDLIQYRLENEKTVSCINDRAVNTKHGEFILKTYLDTISDERHFAFVKGDVDGNKPVLTRVHVANTVRDTLGLKRSGDDDYRSWTFDSAMAKVAKEGCGVVVLLYHNETTQEIEESIDWFLSGKQSHSKKDLVYKRIGTGSQILKDLGVSKMKIMSAPFRFNAISGFNLEVSEYVECE